MNTQRFDILVIGAGPGGYVAAIRAAQHGLSAAVVEEKHLGGICLNWGCIPTKALLKSADLMHEIRHAGDHGITLGTPEVDFGKVIKRSREVAERMAKGIAFLLKKNKITHLEGRGTLVAPGRVSVTGAFTGEVEAAHVILATGARPKELPALAPFDGKVVLSSKHALIQPSAPKTLAVIGAGAIGVEFASFYADFGSEVTLIEALPQLLPVEDEESARVVERSFKKRGIRCLTSAKVSALRVKKAGAELDLETKGKAETIRADRVLIAVGVTPNSENLGLESLGVAVERGFVKVDAHSRTNVPGLYAIGDLAGPPLLAHVASFEGLACVDTIAGTPRTVDYSSIPGCTYCRPQVASVGLTEKAAREQFGEQARVGKFPLSASGKAVALGDTEGHVKVITHAKHGEILGAHIVGPEATELIAEFVTAKANELTVHELGGTMHAHPTISEAVMEACEANLGHAIHI